MAESERQRLSIRTKEALSQLKKRGVKLGNPANLTAQAGMKGTLKMKEKSSMNPNNIKAKKVILLLNENGMTLRNIAKELNDSGFKTANNKFFQPEQVRRLLN